MLAELRAEHQQIEEAIAVLQRLAIGGGGKRRGRPPKWMSQAGASVAPVPVVSARRRKRFSAATRKRMAEAQRKRWATRKSNAA